MPLASGKRQLVRDALVLSALALLIVALARPQVPGRTSSGKEDDSKGIGDDLSGYIELHALPGRRP